MADFSENGHPAIEDPPLSIREVPDDRNLEQMHLPGMDWVAQIAQGAVLQRTAKRGKHG